MTNSESFGSSGQRAETAHAEAPHLAGADLSLDQPGDQLGRLQAGDRDALERVLNSIRPRLAAAALKIVRNRDDADDVVQDAMLKVWRYIHRFEGRAALSTWVHRIVVNTAVDHLRARRRGPVGSGPATDSSDDQEPHIPEGVSDETPEDLLARAETGAWVREGMAHLSLVHREVLALRELQGESYQSIAEIARCPVGTVMSRLHHARQRLAETLAPRAPEATRQAA
jgi:RNA polymerase sigma-70 factor, ECF subfamily